jgi:hypothetical protein
MSSPLDDNDKSEDIDVDLGDEGDVGEAVTRGSVAAKADWISTVSSSSLSSSMALYSNAKGSFGMGATAARG